MPRVAFVLRSTEVHPDCDELCHTERNQDALALAPCTLHLAPCTTLHLALALALAPCTLPLRLFLGQVLGRADRNCGEWIALFFFSGLNLGQVLGRADRNCEEWIALFLFSGLNLGQVLGRADKNCGEWIALFFFFGSEPRAGARPS